MSSPQEQFAELTRRTQENFKNLWQQWSERSTELMKGLSGRSQPTTSAPGNPEEVLDAVFDFAEHMIEQQRAFAKQMLKAASRARRSRAPQVRRVGLALVIGTQHPRGAACYFVRGLGGAARRERGKADFAKSEPPGLGNGSL
jgi:hypothetical protein